MNLQTVGTTRPKLSLQFGRTNRLLAERPALNDGILSAHELRRIVSEIVG
jgi:hypothetical protein